MMNIKPKILFAIGAVMVIIGFFIPLLMVIHVIPKILWIEILVALLQLFGVLSGIIGSALYVRVKKDEKDRY